MELKLTQEEIAILKKICENPLFKKKKTIHIKDIDSLSKLRNTICSQYDILEKDFLSQRRDKHLVDARKQFVKAAISLGRYSTKQIGDAFGKDHATVYHYLKKENQLNQND